MTQTTKAKRQWGLTIDGRRVNGIDISKADISRFQAVCQLIPKHSKNKDKDWQAAVFAVTGVIVTTRLIP